MSAHDHDHGDAGRVDNTRALKIALTPVLCGSSFKNKGVQPLLDAVLDYLPSPLDVPAVQGLEPVRGSDNGGEPAHRDASDEEPFAALAFKIMADPYVGKLTYFRVYSGKRVLVTGHTGFKGAWLCEWLLGLGADLERNLQ